VNRAEVDCGDDGFKELADAGLETEPA